MSELAARFSLQYDWDQRRRVIAGREIVVHCHHYNSRIQSTIESARGIDGKQLLRSVAEAVFAEHVALALAPGDDLPTKWRVAAALYRHLGLGKLDLTGVDAGYVEAPSSHAVEGWNAGFGGRTAPVCTVTEGYLAGAHAAVTGEAVAYRETACRVAGADACRFERLPGAREAIPPVAKTAFEVVPQAAPPRPKSLDTDRIIRALVDMPIAGNAEGLIPALGVYLASMPADFYNLVGIRFLEEMSAKGLGRTAQRLLVSDAEASALNTFRGITGSAEWRGLVAPMLNDTPDKLHAIVAVANALGWGQWLVASHSPGETLRIESRTGYEATGYRALRETAADPRCFVLRGAAAGMMALVYGAGTVSERLGTFVATETACIACGHESCSCEVRRS